MEQTDYSPVWNTISTILVITAISIGIIDINFKEIIKLISDGLKLLDITGGQIPCFSSKRSLPLYWLYSRLYLCYMHAWLSVCLLISTEACVLCRLRDFIISQIITSLAATTGFLRGIYDFIIGLPINQMIHVSFISIIIVELIDCVIFYFITKFMLTRKLNLE